MGSFPLRINRISDNLRVIQDELSSIAQHELAGVITASPFGESDLRALRKVKGSVDHLRQVLRCYIDFASSQLEEHEGEELAQERARRTTLILRYACERLQSGESLHGEGSVSLFDQLLQLAFATVDREMPDLQPELATAAADD